MQEYKRLEEGRIISGALQLQAEANTQRRERTVQTNFNDRASDRSGRTLTDEEYRTYLSKLQGKLMKAIADIESIKLSLPEPCAVKEDGS